MYKSYYVRIGKFKHELQARASEGPNQKTNLNNLQYHNSVKLKLTKHLK